MRVVISVIVVAALWVSAIAHTAAANPAPRPCGEPVPGREMDGDEQAMLDSLNIYRAARQLLLLTPATPLLAAAQAKVSEADRLPAFIHDDPDRTWEDRIGDCGYPSGAAFGEVFGCGSDGIDAIVRSWQESPVHSAVLGNNLFIAAGIARAGRPDGEQCWVINLGSVVL